MIAIVAASSSAPFKRASPKPVRLHVPGSFYFGRCNCQELRICEIRGFSAYVPEEGILPDLDIHSVLRRASVW